MLELTPTVADVVEYQLPENVRAQENELFVKFLKYYYDWLLQEGQPAEVIQNLLSYRDIDLASPEFRKYLTGTMLKFIPASSVTDQTLLAKHLAEFLRSKGTYESFQFIMRAVYGEEIEMQWNSEKLFRPSSNEYANTATVAIESTISWTDVEGSLIVQYEPSQASASIESCTTTTVNGKNINGLTINEKNIIGTFVPDGIVKVLKNTVNRNWYEENYYYTPTFKSDTTLTFKAVKEESRPYEGLIVKQLNSTFRAKISTFISRTPSTGYNVIKVNIESLTGTYNPSEDIYIFAEAIEDSIILRTDYEYGIVSHSVGKIEIENGGSLYVPSEPISFIGGTGSNVEALVSEVSGGSITEVNVVKKGYGYAVGDALTVSNDVDGTGFAAEVSSIDGIDGEINIISELSSVEIINGGYDYAVGDEIEILDGSRVEGTAPIKLTVLTVDSGWEFLDVGISSPGVGYPRYSKVALVDTDTTELVGGFAASIVFDNFGSFTDIVVTSIPTISTKNLAVTINGYGATATTVLSGQTITGTNITNDGVNYINPIIEVIGDGSGAMLIPNLTAGKISSITIVDGGSNYTVATLVIRERYGYGAVLTPLIKNQTDSLGAISTVTLTDRGNYSSIPSCHNISPTTKTGLGAGAKLNLSFRAKSASILNSGQFYYAVTTGISGNGSGAILKAYQSGGVVNKVYVVDGGHDYYYGTTITIPGGTLACDLSPVIVNGVITEVTIVDGGTGYVDNDMPNLVIDNGTDIALSTTIAGTGKVVNYEIIGDGQGYFDSTEVTPLSITTGVAGTGAKFLPALSETGEIIRIDVLEGGTGYTGASTIIVSGGGGSSASLLPIVFNGRITDVIVENGGSGYQYGTYAIILGDGIDCAITPVVETGITEANVISGGTGYSLASTITITDPDATAAGLTPTGAEIRAVIVDGSITALEVIKKGTGYLNPQISLGAPGSAAVVSATAKRNISSLTITNAGSAYTYADVLLIGDGIEAGFSLSVEKLGAIETVAVDTAGDGYTSTPTVTITDSSGYGAASKVKITNPGAGYRRLPVLSLAEKFDISDNLIASGTKFTCFGSDVGSVKNVMFNNHGAEYDSQPKAVFGVNALLIENAAFREGELVTIQHGVYRDEITDLNFLLENDDVLITEEADYLLLDIDDVFYDIGVYGTVKAFDFDRNLISLTGLSDTFFITDEQGNQIVTQNDSYFVSQESGSFDVGDVIIGENSKSRATIGKLNRASGQCVAGGNGYTSYEYLNDVGMLNNPQSVIPDNNRYQDRAYVIQCGRALEDYARMLKRTVHPAGYGMFGDVKTQTMLDMNLLGEIGYNRLLALLTIYAIVLDGFESEWSTMDELFGEFTKFNFEIPIDWIDQYSIRETSMYSLEHATQYIAQPLYSDDLMLWTANANASRSVSDKIHPSGSDYMTRVADINSGASSYLNKAIASTIGNSYSIESFIGAQENVSTFPRVEIGDKYLALNTMTGEYYTNATDFVVAYVGDYWWVRLSAIATLTTTEAKLYPCFGYIANGLNIQSAAATGSITAAESYLRDVTGASSYIKALRGINSMYDPVTFRVLAVESDMDWPSVMLESGDLALAEDENILGLNY